jgi:hypothetical protein
MPASTSDTATSESTSPDSSFSERMAVINYSPCLALSERESLRATKLGLSAPPILTVTRPICGNARSLVWKRRHQI